jgi:SSS family solute:Na+ symporter
MPQLSDHHVEFGVFLGLFGVVILLGFWAARWRQPQSFRNLEEWGLGGRSFGPVLTWFLVSGDLYTAYTFVALPALMYAVGGGGFFAVGFATITVPLVFVALTRMWSVSHSHGLITPADFVRVRFGSPGLALAVAVAGIVGTLPYISLQLLGIEAVFATIGLEGTWPLWVAFGILALFTYNAGLRAPALISILKDILILWVVLAALVTVASKGGWSRVFGAAATKFEATSSRGDGLLLSSASQLNYMTLVLGSALALFLYPHAITGILAAKNRASVRRALAALPIYTFVLGIVGLFGYIAIAERILPVGADPAASVPGDRNTIMPRLFDLNFPDWVAGTAYAAIVIGAFVPAAIMSIAAANLFTRNIYKEYIRRGASPAEQTRVSRLVSLGVKFGAVAIIVLLDPQFSLDLQLIGGVIILQTLPPVAIGLFTAWLHRTALIAGLVTGLVTGLILLYQSPLLGPDGRVIRAHFGSSAWSLSHLGIEGGYSVYAGLIALVLNILVAVVATPVLRAFRVPDGKDITWRRDYSADEGDPQLRRMDEILDGKPMELPSTEIPAKHAVPPSLVGQGRRALTAFPERPKTTLPDRERRQAAPFDPDPRWDGPMDRERPRVAPFDPDPRLDASVGRERPRVASFDPDPVLDAPSDRAQPQAAPVDPEPSQEASSRHDWWGRNR